MRGFGVLVYDHVSDQHVGQVARLQPQATTSVEVTVRVTVAADPDDEIVVSGGQLIRQPRGDKVADLWISVHVPEDSRTTVTATAQ